MGLIKEKGDSEMKTTTAIMQDVLLEIIGDGETDYLNEDGECIEIADVRTFEFAGLMTRDKGLVVKLKDGTEFQLTIVKSR
jgi:hypothetical protein